MKPESTVITGDEYLLRRVHRSQFRTDGALSVLPSAFVPRLPGKSRDPDLTGISLYRESCLVRTDDILAPIDEAKRPSTGIVRISVAVFAELGLHIDPDPVPDVPGHVVIRELRADEYAANKGRLTPILYRLAEAASQDIVRHPQEA